MIFDWSNMVAALTPEQKEELARFVARSLAVPHFDSEGEVDEHTCAYCIEGDSEDKKHSGTFWHKSWCVGIQLAMALGIGNDLNVRPVTVEELEPHRRLKS
jgi:uncharacterized protein CbrC (UPF0167 family)